ncbi:MAG TPA: hypothetical protein VLF41_00280 [Candidatus Nanoarchaeia archaeon]|nr:hypothetical protein [Candidatus Nanoarchaeia archaeon]
MPKPVKKPAKSTPPVPLYQQAEPRLMVVLLTVLFTAALAFVVLKAIHAAAKPAVYDQTQTELH